MSVRDQRILVTGAGGKLGSLIAAGLRKKLPDARIIATARDIGADGPRLLAAQGVELRAADYDKPSSLDTAFKDVDQLLLVSSNQVGKRAPQHRNVIDAAKRAGIKLIGYTSVLRADRSPLGLAEEHRQTEAALAASGLPFFVLRNGWYTENYTASIPAALAHGTVLGSAGTGRISSAARADYADAAVAVLSSEESQGGRVLELAGDTSYTLADYAAELSRQTGKTIGYTDLPEAEYKAVLLKAGLPEPFAALIADSDACAAKGALFDDSAVLSRLIGHPTAPLAQSIAEALQG
jgi:NAD(P)H dehydrogenase (quinone)